MLSKFPSGVSATCDFCYFFFCYRALQGFFFSHFPLFEFHVHRLRLSVEKACFGQSGTFPNQVMKVRLLCLSVIVYCVCVCVPAFVCLALCLSVRLSSVFSVSALVTCSLGDQDSQ